MFLMFDEWCDEHIPQELYKFLKSRESSTSAGMGHVSCAATPPAAHTNSGKAMAENVFIEMMRRDLQTEVMMYSLMNIK